MTLGSDSPGRSVVRAPNAPCRHEEHRSNALACRGHVDVWGGRCWDGRVDDGLRAELLARRDEDQRGRHLISRRAELVARRGWPGRSSVGEDGAHAAWLLAQHADRRPELQQVFLEAMRGAVKMGEASPADLAYLEDRVRINAGRPQLYGTQFVGIGEEFGPAPIEEPHGLDQRRASVRLQPFPITKPTCVS
jgi:hypothetical protein